MISLQNKFGILESGQIQIHAHSEDLGAGKETALKSTSS